MTLLKEHSQKLAAQEFPQYEKKGGRASDNQQIDMLELYQSSVTMVVNKENELIPTRVQSSWRVCIDYQKLNQAMRKDHYPLSFID